jgi:hypothetical protein
LAFFGTAQLRATVLDARRGEVYGAVYDDALEQVVGDEAVMKFPAWIKTLPPADFEFVSTDFSPFQSFVDAECPGGDCPARVGCCDWSDRVAVNFRPGHARDPAEIDATNPAVRR